MNNRLVLESCVKVWSTFRENGAKTPAVHFDDWCADLTTARDDEDGDNMISAKFQKLTEEEKELVRTIFYMCEMQKSVIRVCVRVCWMVVMTRQR